MGYIETYKQTKQTTVSRTVTSMQQEKIEAKPSRYSESEQEKKKKQKLERNVETKSRRTLKYQMIPSVKPETHHQLLIIHPTIANEQTPCRIRLLFLS